MPPDGPPRLALHARETADPPVLVLSAAGVIDGGTGRPLEKRFEEELRTGRARIVLDLGRTDLCSSFGWAVIAAAHREALKKGGGVRIAAMRRGVEDAWRALGLHHRIAAYPTVDEAVASFSPSAA